MRRVFIFATVLPALVGCSQTSGDTQATRLAATGVSDCPVEIFGGHQYAFCDKATQFTDARAACEAAGGHLVSMDSAGEDVFVHAHARKKVWIGGVYAMQHGDWRWLGSDQPFWSGGRAGSPAPGSYTNWAVHEPNNQEHHSCSGMSAHDGRWNAWECNAHAGFVCEIETAGPTPPGPDAHCSKANRGGHDYWFCRDDRSFADARARCQGVGMDLATIADSAENAFVGARADGQSYVGLNDRGNEAAWKWLAGGELTWCGDDDGRKATSGSFAAWANGQPSTARCTSETRNGHSYWFCDSEVSFATARDACQGVGMTLAKIDDAAEDEFVRGRAGNVAWLGAEDTAVEGTWSWHVDGVQFWANQPVAGVYANWKQGQPSGGASANCLIAQKQGGGTWAAAACNDRNGFVCESRTGGDFQLPDHNDCATVAGATGKWTAVGCGEPHGYVCETVDANAYATLDQLTTRIREDYRTGKPRVGDVEFRDNTQVNDPFNRFSRRLGLRECVDALEPAGAARPVPALAREAIEYSQTYKQLPVHGRGYTVHRDPATRFAKSFTGRVEHGISVDTRPAISERQAFGKVKEKLEIPPNAAHTLSGVTGTLAIFAKTEGAQPAWELAYLFSVPGGNGWRATDVVVSAKTGAVLMAMPHVRRACLSQDVRDLSLLPRDIDVTTLPQSNWDDPRNLAVVRPDSNPTRNFLYSSPSGGPRVTTECAGEDFPIVAAIDSGTDPVIVSQGSDDQYRGAAFQMGVQRCLEFYARDLKTSAGTPWRGFDGTGTVPIRISLFRDSADPNATGFCTGSGACYDPTDKTINYNPDTLPFFGASTEIACHELSHGVFDHTAQRRVVVNGLNAVTLDEGIADIFGNAAEMMVRGYPGVGAWCIGGDEYSNMTCLSDMRDPHRSSGTGCRIRNASGALIFEKCPKEYLGPDYCTLEMCGADDDPIECCTQHRNGTVMSHWAYLVAHGQTGQNGIGCNYAVTPLSADLRTSVTQAAQLVHGVLRDRAFNPDDGYPAIADATITAAGRISEAAAQSVTQAWFATNVKEALTDADAREIFPPRGDEAANPWVQFRWPRDPNVTSWDIQIAQRGPFENSTVYRNTGTRFSVALPENSVDSWFWRVRPHSDEAWSDCYPIHAINGTRAVDVMEELSILGTPAGNGTFRPGRIRVGWTKIGGAERYEVTLSATGDRNCMPDSNSITATFEQDPEDTGTGRFEVDITDVQPQEHYHLNVQPIGPEDVFTRQPARGECRTVEFDTAAMRAPELNAPFDGENAFAFPPVGRTTGSFADPAWRWVAFDGASQYLMRFFEITSGGSCEATPAVTHPGELPSSCSGPFQGETCFAANGESLLPELNPTGYCWDVQSIAANGKVSPFSERWRFHYLNRGPNKVSPGLQIGLTETGQTWTLAGDSFGSRVRFRWDADPLAVSYGFKIGRHPWSTPLSGIDPANCWIPPGRPSFTCMSGPGEPVFSAETSDTDFRVDGEHASMGRYCWSVWPIISGSRQPLVDPFPQFCYTSGPERPAIDCRNVPGDGNFTGEPIRCTVTSAYVPAKQIQVRVAGAEEGQVSIDDSDCQPEPRDPAANAASFNDIYDCVIRVDIVPQPDQELTVIGRTWNSDQQPPVRDGDSQLDDVEFPINTGALPAAPVPIYPLADDRVVGGKWDYAEWEPVDGATEYKFSVWVDGFEEATYEEVFVTGTTVDVPFSIARGTPRRVCWQVQVSVPPMDMDGEPILGIPSDPICFALVSPSITIRSPADGSNVQAPTLRIEWVATDAPDHYGIFATNSLGEVVFRIDDIAHQGAPTAVQSASHAVTPGQELRVNVCVDYPAFGISSCKSVAVSVVEACSGPTTLRAPDLHRYSNYERFCAPVGGGCVRLDDDLCPSRCQLQDPNTGAPVSVEQLIDAGVIPCHRGPDASLLFNAASGATNYITYAWLHGTNAIVQDQVQRDSTILLVDGDGDFGLSTGQNAAFLIGVRGVDSCGRKGPADIGMLAVGPACN